MKAQTFSREKLFFNIFGLFNCDSHGKSHSLYALTYRPFFTSMPKAPGNSNKGLQPPHYIFPLLVKTNIQLIGVHINHSKMPEWSHRLEYRVSERLRWDILHPNKSKNHIFAINKFKLFIDDVSKTLLKSVLVDRIIMGKKK